MRRGAFVIGLVMLGLVGGALAAKEAKRAIVQQRVSELKWSEVAPGVPIVEAPVWQGPGGSHCVFDKFPRGFAEPEHFHTHDIHAIVIEGRWGSGLPGAPEQLVAPGGYQLIPGGLKHTTKCAPDVDCVVYVCLPGAFDVKGLPPEPKKK